MNIVIQFVVENLSTVWSQLPATSQLFATDRIVAAGHGICRQTFDILSTTSQQLIPTRLLNESTATSSI